ncbi:hypothetical protein B0H14DRAFT_2916328 [Mycena olivaceomarginata]|nr:hypothetical protein B0H14DRAFT_2916328 [Mycena olivaceomarginata]
MLRLTSRLTRRSLTMPPARKSSSEVPPKGYAIDPSAGPMLQYAQTEAAVHAGEARAADPGTLSWLSEWWNDAAYMGYRDPVVVFVSYFYIHVDDPRRSLLKAMLPFRTLTETKELEPEKWLFHSSRYPTKPSDTARKFDPALTTTQIERVIELAGDTPATPVGALTSDNRDNWTDARAALLAADPANAASLEASRAHDYPRTREEISTACWVGDGRNRFYDKHQLIVFDNGRSGFLAPLALNAVTRDLVKGAEARFDALVAAHVLHVLHYEGYGKDVVKRFGVSPDAWAQLVKQLAFHKMFGRGVTYESAQTRKYQLGRTEVIRSASSESKAWAEAMLDVNESDGRKMLKEGEDVPELYLDPAFGKTSHWELSTSQLSSPYLDGWGYGEVVPDGYGLSYAIGDRYIRGPSRARGDAGQLRHYLAEAATELRDMMERGVTQEKKEMGMEGKTKL